MASRGPPRIIIAGAPASGKGTQCEFIKAEWGCVHLSTGDMLRAAVAAGSALGLEAKGFMDSGKLVPDSLMIGIIIARLAEADCVERGWLLDGFPRTRAQADALAEAGLVCDVFVLLDVPDSLLVERVTGRRSDPVTGKIYHVKYSPPESEEIAARLTQRSDDTEEAIMVRIEAFHKNLSSILDVYKTCTIKVDGGRPPPLVWSQLRAAIPTFLK
jgi:adenylate kinase